MAVNITPAPFGTVIIPFAVTVSTVFENNTPDRNSPGAVHTIVVTIIIYRMIGVGRKRRRDNDCPVVGTVGEAYLFGPTAIPVTVPTEKIRSESRG